jgi:hypothetical protein
MLDYSKLLDLFCPLRLACLDAHPTDVLSDIVFVSKFLEFFKATDVIEFFDLLLDGTGRAEGDALTALATRSLQRLICMQREIGEDGDQPDPRPVLRMDDEVISAEPSQSRCLRYSLMGEVSPLAFPIHDLRGSDGKGPAPHVLDQGSHVKGDPIQDIVGLAIMVQVEQGRVVINPLQNGVREPYADRDPLPTLGSPP